MEKVSREMHGLLALARREQASDIHIVGGLPPMLRINGEIVMVETPPLQHVDTERLCLGLLNEEQVRAFREAWQLCCSVHDPELGRFRVSLYYHEGAPEMAIRPVMDQVADRQTLRLPETIEDLSRLRSGLVLITGPTGSGKTTTLNFMIDLINAERRCKIIAIEDPVEYVHQRKKAVIVQQELHTDVKSFGSALIHVLRQDPDVICVGEMRDMDTTETALVAAETGHLVIATCHTPNVVQTAERIVAIFPENKQPQVYTQLANCLQGVVAQRLIPTVDGRRRVLAAEVLLMSPAARKHIRDRQLHLLVNVVQTGRRQGMATMDEALLELYEAGEIGYEAVINHASDAVGIKERLHKMGGD